MATGTTAATAATRPPRPVRWWRRPWIAPLAIVTAVFLLTALPRYVGLDPALSLVPTDRGPAFYPALVTHILAGSVMLSAAVLQLWPWLRTHHPRVHRWNGRAYVVSALVTGLAALVTAQFPSAGAAQQVANTFLAVLLLAATLLGYRAIRQRRFGDHRAWMTRSAALAFSIVANRFWAPVLIGAYVPGAFTDPDIAFGAPEIEGAAIASAWVSWIVNLMVAEWWIQRRPVRRGRAK